MAISIYSILKLSCLLLIFFIFLAGIYEFVENNESNGCEMTYMFEKMQYIKQNMLPSARQKYPRYQLFAYGEGGQAEMFRDPSTPVQGVPVLFIPGNMGSYKQVRSLASVTYRMGHHRSLTTQFDFFSIDFNEEMYGFYGGNIRLQTEFLKDCILHVMSLYTNPRYKPSKVVLVGHSMGGLLARALFALTDIDKNLVNLIITQATPHQAPIFHTDYLPDLYDEINYYWKREKNDSLKHIVLVSVGGGDRDILVNYHLTRLDGLVHPYRAISVNTESVPRAWVSTDHLCAIWCRQIVLALSRALCDLTTHDSNSLDSQLSTIRNTFGFHLLNHTSHQRASDTPTKLKSPSDQFEYDVLDSDHLYLYQYTASMDKYFAFKVDKSRHSEMVIESNNRWKSWIFGCVQSRADDSCVRGNDITFLQRLSPTESPRVYLHIDIATLHQYTHIVIHVSATDNPVFLHARLFNLNSYTTVYHTPTPVDLIADFPRSLYHHVDAVINETEEKTNYHVLQLPTLHSVYQAYTAKVEITSCSSKKVLASFMRLSLPWAVGSDTFSVINPSAGGGSISLKLHVPYRERGGSPSLRSNSALLHLYLQPTCRYQVTVGIDFRKSLSQFARHYYALLPSFVIGSLFMVLCHQLFIVSQGKPCPDISTAQDAYGQPWKLALATSVIELLLSQEVISSKTVAAGLPLSDGAVLESRGLMFLGLHIILYTIALVVVRWYALLTRGMLTLLGTVMRYLFHRIFTHHTIPTIGSMVWWMLLTLGIYSSWNYCGSVGLLVTFILIVADIVASMVTFARDDRRHTMWYLQHTLLLLTLAMFILSLPEFITWIKNYRFIKTLDLDPSRYPSIVIATSLMLVRFSTDYENWYLSYANSFSPVVLAVAAILYGTVNIWRLTVLIPTVFVWVASVQSLGILLHRQKHSDTIYKQKSEDLISKNLARNHNSLSSGIKVD